jgi:hypothetical protein
MTMEHHSKNTKPSSMSILTKVMNLKTPKDGLIKQLSTSFVFPSLSGIVCNFALHYMCDNATNIHNLLEFNHKLLSNDGLFIFSVMDGAKVFNLLKSGDYNIHQDDILKYSIRSKYKSDKLGLYGQKIDVLLPFSREMYEEPLVNLDNVIHIAEKMGFELVLRSSFMDFKISNVLLNKLTDDDKQYIELHSIIILKKIK